MEINKVQILIRSFLFETKNVIENKEESWEWLKRFRDTLNYQNLETNPLPYALKLLNEAGEFNNKHKQSQMMRWAKIDLINSGISNPTKEQILQKCREKYQEFFEPEANQQPQPQPQKLNNIQQQKKKHPMPNDKQIVLDWAIDNNLDVDDAGECWEATTERNGCDADGRQVNDWKAFVAKWCKSRAKNRKQRG